MRNLKFFYGLLHYSRLCLQWIFFCTRQGDLDRFWKSGRPVHAATGPQRSETIPRAPPGSSRPPRPPQRLLAPSGARYPSEFNGFCGIWWLQPLCKLQWGSMGNGENFEIPNPYLSELRGPMKDLSSAIVSTHRYLKNVGATFLRFFVIFEKKWSKNEKNPKIHCFGSDLMDFWFSIIFR